jgi:hypothetical protein
LIPPARIALISLALSWFGMALAQDGRVSLIGADPVNFTVTPEALAAAGDCTNCSAIEPDTGTGVTLRVTRQNPNRMYTIDVLHDGWGPNADLALEARYTVVAASGGTALLTTPWLPLHTAPTLVFTQAAVQSENRVRVDVAYRLTLRGDEPAGTFVTRVVHRVRESGAAAAHEVRVSLPSYLTLRVVGHTGGSAATVVAFDYGDAPDAYLQAVTSGKPLRPTSGELVRVEVATNHPSGYTVALNVAPLLTPADGPALRERLWLDGAPAHGRRFVASGPTDGFVTLATGADYGLRVEGDESPGGYLFAITYEAVRNP